LHRGSSVGTAQTLVGNANRTYKSKFKRALKRVDVPDVLQQGIPVMRVYANGEKPKKQYLTLSPDKFTLYITSTPMHSRHFQEEKKPKSWKVMSLFRTSSVESASSKSSVEVAESLRKRANKEVRTIDIGEIHRIQRGAHNANLRSTTTSAATVQNLTRRSRSDIKNKIASPLSTPNSSRHNRHSGSASSLTTNDLASSSNIYNQFDISNLQNSGNASFDFKNPDFVAENTSTDSKSRFSLSSNKMSASASVSTTLATTSLDPGMCFSIIFRGDWTLDLMMTDFDIMTTKTEAKATRDRRTSSRKNNDDTSVSSVSRITRDEMLDALDNLIQAYKNAKRQVSSDVLLLRYVWRQADQDKSNTITKNELGIVFDRINYKAGNGAKSESSAIYDQFCKVISLDSKNKKHGLTFEQTCTLLHKTKRDSWTIKPVKLYWNTLFGEFMNNGKERMTVSSKTFLENFLHKMQGERNATLEDVNKLFKRLNAIELPLVAGEGLDPTRIDKDRFEVYLLGEDNDAFDPRQEAYEDQSMHQPISEYWINSSHNTYLTGDQLTSNSSIDMYSIALYRGCKCLELDMWDGGYSSDGDPVPVVLHGHTMTSKILYTDIIKAIKLYVNFHPDTFPLILSYENHCTIPYQEVMAQQLTEILGDSLYIPKEDSLQGRLPSPSELRGMVVIKGRRPASLGLEDMDYWNTSDDGAPSKTCTSDVSAQVPTAAAVSSQQQLLPQQNMVLQKVCPALARLTLFHGTKIKTWDDSLMSPTHYMHSFVESKIKTLARNPDRQKWLIYNQSHMSRTYPSGARISSSNYSPILPWAMGTQLVALNFQTVGIPLLLNDGRFRENGGCGYVLKPFSKLFESQEPASELNKESRRPTVLSVRILNGSCLPKPNDARKGPCINPYVRVSVHDVANGGNREIKETETSFCTNAAANGFYPIWNSETFTFQIENYATAMLQMGVYTGSDELIGSASIPISCLRKGLRSVKLFDTSNTRSGAFDFASLLIEVKKQKVKGGTESTRKVEVKKPQPPKAKGGTESTMGEI